MTKTEYVARVIYFYSKNKPRVGYLTFDKKKDGFGIVEGGSLLSKTIPEDGLHCGDTYILTDGCLDFSTKNSRNRNKLEE